MQLSSEDARLLKGTLPFLMADPAETARVFYAHLFAIAPETRGLFVRDLERQGMKLVATLGTIVMRIEDWPAMRPEIEQLGLRHLAYGVRPAHYAPTGRALEAMLAEILGEAYTPPVARAWQNAYALVEGVMVGVGRREPLDLDFD